MRVFHDYWIIKTVLLRIKCVNRLLEKENLDKIDIHGMYKIYDIWPKIASDAYATKYKKIEYMKIKHIVFAGMGLWCDK